MVEPTLNNNEPLRTEPSGRPVSIEKAARASDLPEIGTLVFSCPTTAREIESGIDMDRKTFTDIQNVNIRVHCSDCGEFHEWRVGEGILSGPERPRTGNSKHARAARKITHAKNCERERTARVITGPAH